MTHPETLAAELTELLGDGAAVTAEQSARIAATRDFSWVSPIIQNTIPRTVPDVVVTLRTETAVAALAAFAHARSIPLTPRGKGTSNYGQIIPLAGGSTTASRSLARSPGPVSMSSTISWPVAGTSWRCFRQC
jgi:FAD/FMN-containing dehydrogenase